LSERSGAIDARAARRAFERAAPSYGEASRLEAEVGARMLARLDYVKLEPQRILDAGSGPARESEALRRRYRGAQLIALDFARPMLPRPRRLERWLGRGTLSVCADLGCLPLEPQSIGLVWSNMALHWLAEPISALREFERVLKARGLLMFSTLGPDTLKELRAAAGERVHAFTDMHDWGDMLVAAGFEAPVMDMEMIAIEYTDGTRLLDDLRRSGQTNARADRVRSLAGRRFGDELRRRLAAARTASYEVVYGHAWKRVSSSAEVKTVRVFKRLS
jgi:malonyl-CoA O-methyltransferase